MIRPVAIIEADAESAAEVKHGVEAAGFRADQFARGTSGLQALRTRGFSLAIVGLDLLDTDPLAVCRAASRLAPVIAIATHRNGDTCVGALEAGADDCLCRPFTGRELVARIRNVLRRAENGRMNEDAFQRLAVSVSEMRVRADGIVHDLSRGETELLSHLLDRAPAPVSIATLAELSRVRPSTIVSQIKRLRRKLGPGRLVSRGKFGYQLVID